MDTHRHTQRETGLGDSLIRKVHDLQTERTELSPRHPCKRLGVVVPDHILSAGEVERGRSLVILGHPP